MKGSGLRADIKFILILLSDYKFKKYQKATAKRYRTNVYKVDEIETLSIYKEKYKNCLV